MSALNKIILIGEIYTDPVINVTTDGIEMAKFGLEVDRPASATAAVIQKDRIPVVAWRDVAAAVKAGCQKGSLVLVEGRISVRSFDSQEGERQWVTEVDAREVKLLNATAVETYARPDAPSSLTEKPVVNAAEFDFEDATDTKKTTVFELESELMEDVPF